MPRSPLRTQSKYWGPRFRKLATPSPSVLLVLGRRLRESSLRRRFSPAKWYRAQKWSGIGVVVCLFQQRRHRRAAALPALREVEIRDIRRLVDTVDAIVHQSLEALIGLVRRPPWQCLAIKSAPAIGQWAHSLLKRVGSDCIQRSVRVRKLFTIHTLVASSLPYPRRMLRGQGRAWSYTVSRAWYVVQSWSNC